MLIVVITVSNPDFLLTVRAQTHTHKQLPERAPELGRAVSEELLVSFRSIIRTGSRGRCPCPGELG